MSSVPVLNITT